MKSPLATVLLVLTSVANAKAACPSFSPVLTVVGANIYRPGTSTPDKAGTTLNSRRLAPIDDFLSYLAKALDTKFTDAELNCPYQLLQQWAKAGALLNSPDTPGRVARVWISSAFGFVILKLKMRGREPSAELRQWMSSLAATLRKDYGKPLKAAPYDGLFSNVYPWAGVSSALSAIISVDADDKAKRFADEVWATMLNEIQPDGSLKGELGRKERALIYHQMAANGLLILRYVRSAQGAAEDPAQLRKLKNLLTFIGNSLCDPEKIAAMTGAKQEMPGVWGFRIPFAFAKDVLPESWARCGPKDMSWSAPEYGGGDTRVAAESVTYAIHQK